MDDQQQIFNWGTKCLADKGYTLERPPEIVLQAPWSIVARFITTAGDFFLKQTPPDIYMSKEPNVIRVLAEQFHAPVPIVIAVNTDLHCFIMQDAGEKLRATLKVKFDVDLLCQAIKKYTAIQRATAEHVELFIKLGSPDWRLDKLPLLYDQLLNKTDLIESEGITEDELQKLHDLSPQFLAQCQLLSSYGIPESIGYPDCNDNNVLVDPKTKKMIFVDWGESAIIHPFLNIYNFLFQASKHYGVQANDQNYQKLRDACLENYLDLGTKDQLLEAFHLARRILPIYAALGGYQMMICVDRQAYNAHHANLPRPIADRGFRDFLKQQAI